MNKRNELANGLLTPPSAILGAIEHCRGGLGKDRIFSSGGPLPIGHCDRRMPTPRLAGIEHYRKHFLIWDPVRRFRWAINLSFHGAAFGLYLRYCSLCFCLVIYGIFGPQLHCCVTHCYFCSRYERLSYFWSSCCGLKHSF